MENDNNKLNDQEIVRHEKLKELIDLGVEPFGASFKATYNTKKIEEKYKKNPNLEEKPIKVKIAGRIVRKRGHGKAGFMDIQDRFGKIQLYVKKDNIDELDFKVWKQSDLGDIIGVSGDLFITNTGQLSIRVDKYTHLTKALRPLPDKHHGLQDREEARRKRYLDLISNEKARYIAFKRPEIIRAFQTFFDKNGFVEVETPVLQSILGGASARPFITHHNALHMNFYLRIATEIPLKKLIVGGMERVYEIGRLFRNEGMDSTHNPEFTTLEAYQAYSDMQGMMDLCEKAIRFVVKKVLNSNTIICGEHKINIKKPFKKIKMHEAIKKETGIDFSNVTSSKVAKTLAKNHGIEVKPHYKVGHIMQEFFDKYVEDKLIEPTFIYHYPLDISPLAKKNKNDPNFTDRFELFINGVEYANAYSELNDPIDQLSRFQNQLEERDKGNLEAAELDSDYIEALEYGLPPTGGIGIGIDRLAMLLLDTPSIRDVILFPHLKEKVKHPEDDK